MYKYMYINSTDGDWISRNMFGPPPRKQWQNLGSRLKFCNEKFMVSLRGHVASLSSESVILLTPERR